MISFNELALTVFLICVVTYFLLMVYNTLRGKSSRRTNLRRIYHNWVHIRIKDESPLTAVQAIRNVLMAISTFITALLLLAGLLIGFFSAKLFDPTPFLGINGLSWGFIQLVSNFILIIFCLFNLILSLRMFVRTSILICGIPSEETENQKSDVEAANDAFITAQNHWMLGIRGFFFLTATLAWIANPILSVIISVGVTAYLIFFQDLWVFKK